MGMNSHQPQAATARSAGAGAFSRRRRSPLSYLVMVIGMLVALVLVQNSSQSPVQAASNVLTLNVVSARTEPKALGGAGVTKGDAITDFKYIINVDNTGTTEQNPYKPASASTGASPAIAGYPDSCHWTSMGVDSIGADLHPGRPERLRRRRPHAARRPLPDLGAGRRLQARRRALHGAAGRTPGLVTVELQPTPLPTATIQAQVFEDIAPDQQRTRPPGRARPRRLRRPDRRHLGEIITDVYGNPLCTHYEDEDPVELRDRPYIIDQSAARRRRLHADPDRRVAGGQLPQRRQRRC